MFDFIYAFHMPLFFMVSGYLYEITWNEKKCSDFTRIKNKLIDLGSLYILFSALFWGGKYLTQSYIQMANLYTWEDLLLIGIKPLSYLWFLYVLMILFVIIPVLEQLKLKKFYILLGALVGYVGWYDAGTIGKIFYGAVYFVLGSWIRQQYRKGRLIENKGKGLILALFICTVNIFYYILAGHTVDNVDILRKIIVALSGSYIIWYLFYEYIDKIGGMWAYFFRKCGVMCLELYLLHTYFLAPLRTIFRKAGIDNLGVCIIIATVIAVLGSLYIAEIGTRNRYLKYLFHPGDLRKIL